MYSNCAIGSSDAAVLQQHAEKAYRCVLQCLVRDNFDPLKDNFLYTLSLYYLTACSTGTLWPPASRIIWSEGAIRSNARLSCGSFLLVELGLRFCSFSSSASAKQGILSDRRAPHSNHSPRGVSRAGCEERWRHHRCLTGNRSSNTLSASVCMLSNNWYIVLLTRVCCSISASGEIALRQCLNSICRIYLPFC